MGWGNILLPAAIPAQPDPCTGAAEMTPEVVVLDAGQIHGAEGDAAHEFGVRRKIAEEGEEFPPVKRLGGQVYMINSEKRREDSSAVR